jgi:hypothetical protein
MEIYDKEVPIAKVTKHMEDLGCNAGEISEFQRLLNLADRSGNWNGCVTLNELRTFSGSNVLSPQDLKNTPAAEIFLTFLARS